MSKFSVFVTPRNTVRIAIAGLAAALLSGCSSDATRFSDPFSNPFSAASNSDPATTGSVASAAPVSSVQSQPLAAPRPLYGARPSAYQTSALAPRPSAPTVIGGNAEGWSATGGTPIVVAEGESVALLSQRYGVPPAALLRSNGFTSSAQVRPGTRLIVPTYRAGAAQTASRSEPRERTQSVSRAETSEPSRVAERRESREHSRVAERGETRERTRTADREDTKEHDRVAERSDTREHARVAKRTETREHTQVAERAETREHTRVAERAEPNVEPSRRDPRVARADSKKLTQADKLAARENDRHPRQAVAANQPVDAPAPTRTKTAPAKLALDTPRKAPTASAPASTDPMPTASLPSATASADNGKPEFRWPARGRIIQGFRPGGNDGINIAVPEGTSVKAAEAGVVAYAGSELKGYGNMILIRHPNGYVSAYANNGELDVKRGDQVKRGQIIAKSGQSGNVNAPQLHFELRKGSTPIDPTGYLAGL